MTGEDRQAGGDYPQVDTSPSEHEQRVAQESEGSDRDRDLAPDSEEDPTLGTGRERMAIGDFAVDVARDEDRLEGNDPDAAAGGAAADEQAGRGGHPAFEPGPRPTAEEDLVADMTPGDER